MSWSAASSSSPTSPMGGSTGSIRAPETAVPITPAGPWRYADLRPDLARRRFYAVREDHSGEGEATNTIVTIPLDGGDPQVAGQGIRFRLRAAPLARRHAARLARMGPPGHALGRDAAAGRGLRARRDARRGHPGGRRPRRIDHPARMGARWHAPPRSATERAGGTSTAWSTGRGWSRSPRWRRSSPTRPGRFDRSSYGFLPDGAVVAVARSGGRDHLYRIEPGARVGRAGDAVHRARVAARRCPRRRRAGRLGRATRPSSRASIRSRWHRPASCAGRRRSPSTRRSSRSPSRSSSRRPATGPPMRSTTRRRTRTSAAPTARSRRSSSLSHGGPTSNASTSLDLGKQFLTSRGIAIVDVDYGGSTGYGRDYRRRLDGQWGVVDVDDCVAAAQYLVERGDVDPRSAGHRGRQRRRLHDARGACLPRRVRGRDQPLRDRRPGAARDGQPQVRVAVHSTACSGRIRRPPPSTASARRATSPTGSRARS